jgi:hypothetical protein
MKEYWYSIHERSMETAAVWENGAPSFVVGELTLDLHKAAVASLNAVLQAQCEAALALGLARSRRDTSHETIRSLCSRGCQIIHGSLPPEEAVRDEVRHVRSVRQESQGALLSKGQRLVSLWQKVDTLRGGLTPPQPALLVGTAGLGAFEQMLKAHSSLLQSVEDLLSDMKTRKNAMRALVKHLDQTNKRWYEAWKGQFGAGSREREFLRQINTGPKRHEPAQAVMLSGEALPGGEVRLAFDAARATWFTLLHQGPGDAVFAALTEKVQLKTFTTGALVPDRQVWTVIGHNSVGDGAESAPFVLEMAQQAA